jgi:hypothetical protein
MKNNQKSVEVEGTENTIEFERVMKNLIEYGSNEINDFFEYEGKIFEKDDVLILVWEDEWCRDEGVTVKMNWSDFESEDFSSLLDSVEEYYDDEIGRIGGSIEIEIKGKPIFHISNDSDDVWEIIK